MWVAGRFMRVWLAGRLSVTAASPSFAGGVEADVLSSALSARPAGVSGRERHQVPHCDAVKGRRAPTTRARIAPDFSCRVCVRYSAALWLRVFARTNQERRFSRLER